MRRAFFVLSSIFMFLGFCLEAQNGTSPADLEYDMMDPTETDSARMDIETEMTKMDEAASRHRQKDAERRARLKQQQQQELQQQQQRNEDFNYQRGVEHL